MRSIPSLCSLLCWASLSCAASPEWEKSVRAAAGYPNSRAMFAVVSDPDGKFALVGETSKPAAEAMTLEDRLKDLRGTPEDFPKLNPVIGMLEAAGQGEKADEYAARAIRLGPEYLNRHPEDTTSMAWL